MSRQLIQDYFNEFDRARHEDLHVIDEATQLDGTIKHELRVDLGYCEAEDSRHALRDRPGNRHPLDMLG